MQGGIAQTKKTMLETINEEETIKIDDQRANGVTGEKPFSLPPIVVRCAEEQGNINTSLQKSTESQNMENLMKAEKQETLNTGDETSDSDDDSSSEAEPNGPFIEYIPRFMTMD